MMGYTYNIRNIVQTLPPGTLEPPPPVNLITRRNTEAVAAQWAHTLRQQGVAVALVNAANAKGRVSLHVHEDGSVQLGQQLFSMEQVDLLLITLSGLVDRQ